MFIIELQETAEDEELRKLKSDFTFARCAATPLPLCDSGTSVEISSTCWSWLRVYFRTALLNAPDSDDKGEVLLLAYCCYWHNYMEFDLSLYSPSNNLKCWVTIRQRVVNQRCFDGQKCCLNRQLTGFWDRTSERHETVLFSYRRSQELLWNADSVYRVSHLWSGSL